VRIRGGGVAHGSRELWRREKSSGVHPKKEGRARFFKKLARIPDSVSRGARGEKEDRPRRD